MLGPVGSAQHLSAVLLAEPHRPNNVLLSLTAMPPLKTCNSIQCEQLAPRDQRWSERY